MGFKTTPSESASGSVWCTRVVQVRAAMARRFESSWGEWERLETPKVDPVSTPASGFESVGASHHTQIEGAVLALAHGEAAAGLVELRRAHAQIEQHTGDGLIDHFS
jgi:hypothetical protein